MKKFLILFLTIAFLSTQADAGFRPPSGGGSGSPGGSDTQVQFNNSGSFGGDSGFTTDGSGNLNVTGSIGFVDNVEAFFGNSDDAQISYDTANTFDSLFFGVGSDSNIALFGRKADAGTDYVGMARTYPTLRFLAGSSFPNRYLDIFQSDTQSVFNSSYGGLTFEDDASPTGVYYPSVSVIPGDKYELAPSFSEFYPSYHFDGSSSTVSIDSGSPHGVYSTSVIEPLTIEGVSGGSQVFGSATSMILGAPTIGADLTVGTSIGQIIGHPFGLNTNANNISMQAILLPGIDSGVGNTEGIAGITISGPATSGPISLGNQTATTQSIYGLSIDNIPFESDTNTRTVDKMAGIKISTPTVGSNVTVTEGPYAIWSIDSGESSRFDGPILKMRQQVNSANDMPAPESDILQVNGSTQINTMAAPLNGSLVSQIVVMNIVAGTTIKNETSGTGAQFKLQGSADFVASAGDVLTVFYDGTFWKEISRATF